MWREADMWVPHTSGATQASLARHVGLMGGVCTRLDLYDTRQVWGSRNTFWKFGDLDDTDGQVQGPATYFTL